MKIVSLREELSIPTPLLSASSCSIGHSADSLAIGFLSGFDRRAIVHFPSLPEVPRSKTGAPSVLPMQSQRKHEEVAVKRAAPAGLPKWALQPSEVESEVAALKLSENIPQPTDSGSPASIVSLIQTAAVTITASSPLFTTLSPPTTLPQHRSMSTHKISATHKHSWEAPAKSKHGIVNKPVTFHNRIKSSGYGGTVKRSTSAPTPTPSRIRMYPSNCTGGFSLQPQNRFPSPWLFGCRA